jgi:hypothetical protein
MAPRGTLGGVPYPSTGFPTLSTYCCKRSGDSAPRTQPIEGDRHQPTNGGLRALSAGAREGVKAEAGEFIRRHIVPDIAGSYGPDEQLPDHLVNVMLRSGDPLVPMKERREFGVMVIAGSERDEGEGLEHRFESLASVASPVPDFGEICEVARDLTFVPGAQDRLDVGEVLVERRTTDSGLLGDPRHRHRQQAVLGYQRRPGVQDRVVHLAAMRLNRFGPQLRHNRSIRDADTRTP